LDDRLAAGPLPSADVIRFGLEIADALDHAHRQGIVHRDLKPANVMLTAAGAKLLDFGLARIAEPSAGGETATLAMPPGKLTAQGALLGTFQYMAPEQIEGKEADARTDIFAFGTLLYEMATGCRAFDGESRASLIASILTRHPAPLSATRIATGRDRLPAAIDHVVDRCLAKSAAERWQTARDVKLELEWASQAAASREPALPESTRPAIRERIWWLAAASAVAVALTVPRLLPRAQPPAADLIRFVITPPSGAVIPLGEQRTRIALSPNGRQLAFVAIAGGRIQIWVRSLDSLAARPIAGTEGAQSPFWSPDGSYLGFFAPGSGEIRKVALAGGPARTVCAAQVEGLPEWGADGTILFSIFRDGIYRVPAEGGTPTRVTSLDKTRRELNHYWPSFLPDQRHFAFLATANDSETSKAVPSVYIASLDDAQRTLLPRIHSRVVYAPPGYLLFVEEGTLMAQPFDENAIRPRGEPAAVADGVAWLQTLGTAHFSSSVSSVAYLASADPSRMVWYDRQGNATATGWADQAYGSVRISPDGRHAATDVVDPRTGTTDVWIYDLARNVPTRFTSDRASDRNAIWYPDGHTILFTTERGGSPNIFAKPFDRPGDIVPFVTHPGPVFADDWSPDGTVVAYRVNTAQTGQDLWLKPVNGTARPFLNSRYDESNAKFSPDSEWLAFVSDETNAMPQVFVAPVGAPSLRKQVSVDGGLAPRWRRDGKELFFAAPDNRALYSVAIASLEPFRAGIPKKLFSTSAAVAFGERARVAVYDAMPDGGRFLFAIPTEDPVSSRVTMVVNWAASLKR
jgi:Tol biopolymer transport system component